MGEPGVGEAAVGEVTGAPGPGGADDDGWRPADRPAVLRGRRRALVLSAVGLPGAVAVLLAVLSVVQRALPTTFGWLLLGLAVVLGAGALWPLRSAGGRRSWEERTGEDVLLAHALAAHVSVGADRRDAVSRRAENHASLASVAAYGYGLLVLLVAFLLFQNTATAVAIVGTVVAAAFAALALRQSLARGAAARRWLAEPLPEDR